MPLIMKKIYTLTGNYTDEQKQQLINLIDMFRLDQADDDPQKNVLIGKIQKYSDDKIVAFLNRAIKDLNSGAPRTVYTIFNFPEDDTLVEGATVFALMAEGMLQLRNQVNFSDSGLSVNLFDKSAQYQGWSTFMLQQYLQDKAIFKSTVLPLSHNSGFVGIGSEFGYSGW